MKIQTKKKDAVPMCLHPLDALTYQLRQYKAIQWMCWIVEAGGKNMRMCNVENFQH